MPNETELEHDSAIVHQKSDDLEHDHNNLASQHTQDPSGYLGEGLTEWDEGLIASMASMEGIEYMAPPIIDQERHEEPSFPEETLEDRLAGELGQYIGEIRALSQEMKKRPEHRDFPVEAAPLIGAITRESSVLLDKIRTSLGKGSKIWGSFYLRQDTLAYAVDYNTLQQKSEVVNMHDLQQMIASLYLLAKGDGNIFSLNSFGTFIGVPTITRTEYPEKLKAKAVGGEEETETEEDDAYVGVYYKIPSDGSPTATFAVTDHLKTIMRALPDNKNVIVTMEDGLVGLRIKESVLETSSTYSAGRPRYPVASLSFNQMGGRVVNQFGMTYNPDTFNHPARIREFLSMIEEDVIPFFDEKLGESLEVFKDDRLSIPGEIVTAVREAISSYVGHEQRRVMEPIIGYEQMLTIFANKNKIGRQAIKELHARLGAFLQTDDAALPFAEILDAANPDFRPMVNYAYENTKVQFAHLLDTEALARLSHTLTSLVPIDTRRELMHAFDNVATHFRRLEGKDIPVERGGIFESKGTIPRLDCYLDLSAYGGPEKADWTVAKQALSMTPEEAKALFEGDDGSLSEEDLQKKNILSAIEKLPVVASLRGVYDVILINAASNATDINCDTDAIEFGLKLEETVIDGEENFVISIINTGHEPENGTIDQLNDPRRRSVTSTHGGTGKGTKISEILVGAGQKLEPGDEEISKYWRVGKRSDKIPGFELQIAQPIL